MTLENGEVFEFGITCVLDPAAVGDTQFVFYLETPLGSDDPLSLSVSQFTADSFDGAASIVVSDTKTYDPVWSAMSLTAGEVELTLDGNTVRGSGIFLKGVDSSGPGVRGELEASC